MNLTLENLLPVGERAKDKEGPDGNDLDTLKRAIFTRAMAACNIEFDLFSFFLSWFLLVLVLMVGKRKFWALK